MFIDLFGGIALTRNRGYSYLLSSYLPVLQGTSCWTQ